MNEEKDLTSSDQGYWAIRQNRLHELSIYINNHGIIDNSVMKNDDHGKRILWNIYKYKDLMEDMLIELGFDPYVVKPNATKGYYNDFENVSKKIRWFIDSNKRFPAIDEIFNVLKIGHRYIRKHGGIYEIKRKMNYFDDNDLVDSNLFVNSSMLEFLTAQFLIYNEAEYKREKLILPDSNKKYRYDFYLIKNDSYVEVWGYEDKTDSISKNYNKKRQEKEKFYKENNLKLISIEPDDLSIHNFDQVVEKLTEIFSPYINVKDDIPHSIFVSNKTLSDEEILNQIIDFSNDQNYLPVQDVLINNDLGYLTRLIRSRHGSYYDFAKKYNKKIHGKNIDVKEISEELIYELFDEIFGKRKVDILQKHLKKFDIGAAILSWINNDDNFDSLKINYYNNKFKKSSMIVHKSIFSFLIRLSRDNKYNKEIQNKCKSTIKKLLCNDENRKTHEKEFKRILIRFPYTEQEYIDNFNNVIGNEYFKLTPNGFDKYSKMSYYSYLNHYDGMSWIDIVKMMGKEKKLHNYICEEFKKYAENKGYCSIKDFTNNHPYITRGLMEYQDTHKWMEDANITNVNKGRWSDEDLKENFLNIKNIIGNVPLFIEFDEYTKIGYYTYQNRLNIKGKVYDQIVKMYTTDEEYNEYLNRKMKHKSSIGKETGKLSKKHTDEDLKNNFISVFSDYKIKNSKYPSRREFAKFSPIDESTYRTRLNKSWLEVVKYYGLNSDAI